MPSLAIDTLAAYRAQTFRLTADTRLHRRGDAVQFVNQRGFVYFWPISQVTLPSLWAAVAGDRPVADGHDDPGHITWRWKDESLDKRQWYYAKVLRRKATLISLAVAPHFYALSENYGEPEQDYLLQYDEGRLTNEAKTLYETLLTEGPLDTVSLRKLARMTSKASDGAFSRSMDALQADFKILPVGVAQAGAWKYAFIYECVHRWYPDLPAQARSIRQADARRALAELFLRSVGAAQAREFSRLFGWAAVEVEAAIVGLIDSGRAQRGISIPGQPGEWVALTELLENYDPAPLPGPPPAERGEGDN